MSKTLGTLHEDQRRMVLSQKCEKRLLGSSYLSVRLFEWNNSTLNGWILMEFDIWAFFENLSRKLKFHLNLMRITGNIHKVHNIFFIISRSVLLIMRNISNKRCRENQNTYFVIGNFYSKIVPFINNVGKYIRSGQATGDNTKHTHFTLCI
jgi:hypothetical protein